MTPTLKPLQGIVRARIALSPLVAAIETVAVVVQGHKCAPAESRASASFPGESWQRTFDELGSYPYSCGPHPEMKGQVDVPR